MKPELTLFESRLSVAVNSFKSMVNLLILANQESKFRGEVVEESSKHRKYFDLTSK